jgi:hypothetical protein
MLIFEIYISNLAHGTKLSTDVLDVDKTSDGGIHVGSVAQANMRASGSNSKVFNVTIDIEKARRCRDDGGGWAAKIRSAKSARYDSIVYLNRYEGLTTDVIDRLSVSGDLGRLDRISDSQFKKLVPEAEDSYIIFYNDQIRVK